MKNWLKVIFGFKFTKIFFLSQQFEKFQENHEYKMKQAELQVLETRNQKENAELSLKNEIQSWQKKLYEEEEARQKVCFITAIIYKSNVKLSFKRIVKYRQFFLVFFTCFLKYLDI